MAERTPRLAIAIATVGGVGYAPVASGTFGSIPAVLLYWLLAPFGPWPIVATIVAVTAVGLWASGVAERHWGNTDPGRVVIDEVAGQLVTLVFHPANPATLALGFFLFRLFDVTKPFPARRLESLHGGRGIMADDLVAGVYASLTLFAARWAFPQFFGG